MSANQYRALISVPITAANDEEALRLADVAAGKVQDAQTEMVGAVAEGSMQIARVVRASGWLVRQLPLDWKP